MPRGDGTGPKGLGPLTGRARGNCMVKIPDDGTKPVEGLIGRDAKHVVFSGNTGQGRRCGQVGQHRKRGR